MSEEELKELKKRYDRQTDILLILISVSIALIGILAFFVVWLT